MQYTRLAFNWPNLVLTLIPIYGHMGVNSPIIKLLVNLKTASVFVSIYNIFILNSAVSNLKIKFYSYTHNTHN